MPQEPGGTGRVEFRDLIDMLTESKETSLSLLDGMDDIVVELSVKFVDRVIEVVKKEAWGYINYEEWGSIIDEAAKADDSGNGNARRNGNGNGNGSVNEIGSGKAKRKREREEGKDEEEKEEKEEAKNNDEGKIDDEESIQQEEEKE